jgi:hypothetical protein
VNSFVAPGLLGNASDSDGDTALSVATINGQAVTPDQPITLPSGATVIVGSDNSFTYTPPPAWIGTDSFQYTVTDGTFQSSPATITVNVTDQQPVANAEGPFTVLPGATLPIDVLANAYSADSANLTPVIVQGPTLGTATIVNGIIDYTPNPGISSGTDQITYEVSDGILNSSPQTVSITVSSSQPLVTNPVYIGVTPGVETVFSDSDVLAGVQNALSGSTISILGFTDPSFGILTHDGSIGEWYYTPNPNFPTGLDKVSVIISNGTQVATVPILFMAQAPAQQAAQRAAKQGVCLSSDGSLVATYSNDPGQRKIWIWNVATGRQQAVINLNETARAIGQVAFRPGVNNQLAILYQASDSNPEINGVWRLEIWDITTDHVVGVSPRFFPSEVGISFSWAPDGNHIILVTHGAPARAGNTVWLYYLTSSGVFADPTTGERSTHSYSSFYVEGPISANFIDNSTIQVTTRNGVSIWHWNGQRWVRQRMISPPRGSPPADIVAVAGTASTTLALALSNGQVALYRGADRPPTLLADVGAVVRIAVINDFLIAGTAFGNVIMYDISNLARPVRLAAPAAADRHRMRVTDVALAEVGGHIFGFSSSVDGTVKEWDPVGRRVILRRSFVPGS